MNHTLEHFNASLQHGVYDEVVASYKETKLTKDDALAESIFNVFQNTAKILNALKVEKNTSDAKKKKDTMDYLSHTTRLSVFTRQLLPIEEGVKPKEVQKFRLHHIAYANDPTEGTALFKTLAIEPQYTEHAGTIPYIMIASFSAGKSSQALDRLPIWKMYGDDARGISLLFKTQDIASDERGHVGSSPAPKKEMLKKFSYKREEHAVATAMPKTKNEKDTKPPPQILYRVHYMGKDDDEGNAINTLIQAIKKDLEAIKNSPNTLGEEGTSLYGKTLVLLEGLRYLIKDKSYEYENEYRLLCVCTGEHIPDVLKCSDAHTESQDDASRVYVETDLAEKLCAVMTGPKVRDPERVAIQYRLDAYKDVLPKLEERTIWRSDIPYT